jgi:hypothetical protein
MNASKKFHWAPWLLVAALILSLGIVAYFSYRAVRMLPRLRSSETIRPWMTLPYIAHAQRVPLADLYQALGIPYQAHDHRPISRIARSLGVPEQTIIAKLDAAIQQLRPPPGAPTPTHSPPATQQAAP